ncbi:MAG: ATP-binding protein [Solirubrobacterales bacterium]
MSKAVAGGVEPSFVGRARELDAVETALRAAIRGEGPGVLVIGEVGVGKTRLVAELAAAARQDGVRVVWSSVSEPAAARAHGHWAQVLRILAASFERHVLVEELAGDAEGLARLVPDLRSGLELAASSDPEGDDPCFRMYDAVASFLRRAAAREPLAVVLEDLHAADLGTLRLLRFLLGETRHDPIAVVATARDPDTEALPGDVAGALVEVARTVPALHLGGLDRPAVESLMAQIVGADIAAQLAADIHHRSGGNPLFVGELARLLAAEPRRLDHRSLPATIRALLEGRLARVPPEALEVLRAAAVVGEGFAVRLVEHAAGKTRTQVLAAVDEAARAHLVIEHGNLAFGFTHALVRDVLYDQLALPGRTQAHRAVAEALEATGGTEPPLAELAHHFLAGSPAVEDGKAALYAERAGHRAAEQFAYEDAARHFRNALSALDLAGADTSRRIPLLLALGDASLRSGDVGGGRDAFVAAAEHARRAGSPEFLARAALGLGSGLDGFEVRLFDHAQLTLLEEALAALPPEPSALRAWAMARLSVALTFAEPGPRRLQLAEDAVGMARGTDDPRALAYALAARCDAIAGPEHVDERLQAATEITRLAQLVGDRGMELLGHRNRLIALLELGDIAGVDAEIDRYELVADGIGQPLYQWYVPLWRGMRALMDGRLDAAWAHQRDAATIGGRAGSHNAALNAEVLAWNTLRKEGRAQEAADRLRRQLALADGVYGEDFWVALVTPQLHPVQAKAALDRFVARSFAEFPRDAVWLAAMTYAAETCGHLGHTAAAECLDELIRPHHARFAVDAIGAACYGSMARPLGVVATVLGRRTDATGWFDEALQVHRACGVSALVAETLHDIGSSLVSLGDERAGRAALEEANALYASLGMHQRASFVEAPTPPPESGDVFRLDGEYWTLTYGGRTVRVADRKGLRDIAMLLARPGHELHVADLIAATDPPTAPPDARTRAAVLRPASTDAVLDDRARADYRARLVDLRDELEDAEANADIVRAEVARAEMDAIASELATALGLGGRARATGDPAERARKAVTQRIRNSLKRLADVHPELAAHLDRSIRTGRFCTYRPERPVEWSL